MRNKWNGATVNCHKFHRTTKYFVVKNGVRANGRKENTDRQRWKLLGDYYIREYYSWLHKCALPGQTG